LQLVDDEFQAFEFGKEVGLVVGQGVAGAQAGDETGGIRLHLFRADGHAGAGKQVVDAYRAQIGALSCHVGAGDDDEERAFLHVDVVADTTVAVHQGMSQGFCAKHETGVVAGVFRISFLRIGRDVDFGGNHIGLVEQGGIRIVRMIIGEGCQ